MWVTRGVTPGGELFVAAFLCLCVVYYAVRTARAHPPNH